MHVNTSSISLKLNVQFSSSNCTQPLNLLYNAQFFYSINWLLTWQNNMTEPSNTEHVGTQKWLLSSLWHHDGTTAVLEASDLVLVKTTLV